MDLKNTNGNSLPTVKIRQAFSHSREEAAEALNKNIAILLDRFDVPVKEYMCYILAQMLDIIREDMTNELSYIEREYKICNDLMNRSKMRDFKEFSFLYKKASVLFEKCFDKDMDVKFNTYRTKENVRSRANEFIRLMMCFINATANSEEVMQDIFKHIRSYESCKVVSEKTIARYEFK